MIDEKHYDYYNARIVQDAIRIYKDGNIKSSDFIREIMKSESVIEFINDLLAYNGFLTDMDTVDCNISENKND